MSPKVKTVLGFALLAIGVLDLLKFGLQILLQSPALIIGILLTAAGTALISSGRKDNLLR